MDSDTAGAGQRPDEDLDAFLAAIGMTGWRPPWQVGWVFHGLLLLPLLWFSWKLTSPPGNFVVVVVVMAGIIVAPFVPTPRSPST